MIIKQPQILVPENQFEPAIMAKLEKYARICYKSEGKAQKSDAAVFLKSIIARGHESIIEHEKVTAIFIIDRGISHEIVRHRIAAYSQESTRYCNYSKDRFGNEITVIEPFFLRDNKNSYGHWKESCEKAEKSYLKMLQGGCTPQEARSVLPNSLKTEIVTTYNLREWRHFFKLRCDNAAHPQMRQVAIPFLLYFKEKLPALFADIEYDENFPKDNYAEIIPTDELFNPLPKGTIS